MHRHLIHVFAITTALLAVGQTSPGGCGATGPTAVLSQLINNGLTTVVTCSPASPIANQDFVCTATVNREAEESGIQVRNFSWLVDGVAKDFHVVETDGIPPLSDKYTARIAAPGQHFIGVVVMSENDLGERVNDEAEVYVNLLPALPTPSGSTPANPSSQGKPTVSLAASSQSVAKGGSAMVTAEATGGTTPYIYFWLASGDSSWTQGTSNFTKTMNTVGTQSVYCVVRDANNVDSDEYSVDINVTEAVAGNNTYHLVLSARQTPMASTVTASLVLPDGSNPAYDPYNGDGYRWYLDGQELGVMANRVNIGFYQIPGGGGATYGTHVVIGQVLAHGTNTVIAEFQDTITVVPPS